MEQAKSNTIEPTSSSSGRQAPPTTKSFKPNLMASLSAGFFLFISGGMSLIQSLGFIYFGFIMESRHILYCWFIAMALGALIAVLLVYVVPKKYIMAAASVMVLVGGIIRVSSPNSEDALIAARYFNGLGVGVATISYLMYAGELSENRRRGLNLGLEQLGISIGIALQMIMATQWPYSWSLSQDALQGILDIFMVVLTMGSLIYFIE
ncbi:uncharacterized protein LOC133321566 [Musca vetustissima]|uniref:uncharacterized protein LOC133321566 n=1 Tax=Musca vetustissima TaxID=27455 RepID=UPI002AB72D44|nr:uncharacterized protein LOC133321566 [Musca vetustissima]